MLWTSSSIVTAAIALMAAATSLVDASPLSLLGRALVDAPKKAQTHNIKFDVGKFKAAPDGFTMDVLGVNGQTGVPIVVTKGDTINLAVTNNLDEPTAIHFHGMLQNGTNWYDGSSMVTQCPIQPGRSFTYNFKVDNQHGTYWWHAHHKSQYVQGLRGPLIIRDPDNEPYTKDYDSEVIVQLTDWYHRDKNTLLAEFFSVGGIGDEPLPDSGLINFQGSYDCSKVKQTAKKGAPAPLCTGNSSLSIFDVKKSQRVRFRIINMSAMATFNFSIDGHRLDVIEADGVDTKKTTVDSLRINVAQRYSVIVNMNQDPKDYWVRADIDAAQWPQNSTGIFDPSVRAILHYDGGAPAKTPKSKPRANPVILDPFTLATFNYPAPPPDYDIGVAMRFDFLPNDKNITLGYVTIDNLYDTIQYEMPESPTLFDVIDGKTPPNSSLPIYIPRGSVVEMSIWNDDVAEHVFHLHGHQFWVVAHGAVFNSPVHPGPAKNYPVRDTVAVPGCHIRTGNSGEGLCGGGLGYVKIRFIADNPGVWLFHCHMEWHMAAGLAVTYIVDSKAVQGTKLPADLRDTCKK